MKKISAGLVILFCLIIGGLIFLNNDQKSSADKNKQVPIGVTVGTKMPEFTLTSINKNQMTVKNSGKPMLVNFFATWCPPCVEEMPDFNQFAQKYGETVDFYAVNLDESPREVAEYMDARGLNFFKNAVIFDTGKTAREFRVKAIPTTFITDKNGVIRHIHIGAASLKQLENYLQDL